MAWTVLTSGEYDAWWTGLSEDAQVSVAVVVRLLQEQGPLLPRPYCDTLKGSKLANLKELRVQHRGRPHRVLFAFDPKRCAILLTGGDKSRDPRWYERSIRLAEAAWQRHLASLRP